MELNIMTNNIGRMFFFVMRIYIFLIFTLAFSVSIFGKPFIDQELLVKEKPFLVGTATDIKTNALLYKEYHYTLEEGKRYVVVYKNSNNKLIAEKELLYTKKVLNDTNPKLKQNNYLSGETIEVDTLRAEFRVLVEYRESTDDRIERKEFEKPQDLVVDAGFNQLILEEWSTLLKNKTIRFEYLAPSLQRTFAFTARKDQCDETDSELVNMSSNKKEATCFSMAPKSWLMRQIVAPISLVYDSSSKRLLRFSGLGNVGDESGDYMKVNIRYEYADDSPLAHLKLQFFL